MNIIKTFLLTNNENNLIELQDKNKLILGTSSIWMIIPIINGINDYMILSISLSSACIASVFFWNYPKNGTIIHIMDKSCAWIYFVLLLYHSLILLNKYIIILFILLHQPKR